MFVVALSMALAANHEIDPAGAQSALTVGDGQYQLESTVIGWNRTGVTGLMGRQKSLALGITTLRIGVDDDFEYQVAFNGVVIDDERAIFCSNRSNTGHRQVCRHPRDDVPSPI